MRKPLGFLAALAFAVSAHAAPPTESSVEDLLAITQTEKVMESFFTNFEGSMRQGMAAAVQGKPLTEEQQRVLEAAPRKFVAVLREEMSWENMRPLYVRIYQENFTQEEIDGLVAFYRTLAGSAFIAKMPMVMQKSTEMMQSRIGPMARKMQAAMEQALQEAKLE